MNDICSGDINSNEDNFSIKEFRYSEGCFFVDKIRNYVIAWHNCSIKPVYFSPNEFNHIKRDGWVCQACRRPVNIWKEMLSESIQPQLFLSTINYIKIYAVDFKVKIGIYSFISPEYIQITMNIKTGHTYRFNRLILNPKHGFDNKNRNLANISYSGPGFDLPYDATEYVLSLINSKIKMIHGENVPSFESYRVGVLLTNLIFYIKNPYICPTLYNGILNKSRRIPNDCFNPKKLFLRNDCNNPLHRILSLSRVPCVKSIMKIVASEPMGFPFLISLSRTFKNVDLIRSLYTAYVDCRNHDNYIDFSSAVFQTMVKHKGEKYVVTKLLSFIQHDKNNNSYVTLYDTIRFYDRLDSCNFDFTHNYSIDELHMNLAILVSKQEHENRVIDYTQKERNLETSGNVFSLTLAEDTYELIDIGKIMSICVGSYADKVIEKNCTIMVLRNNDVPVGCVELRGDAVVQVKGPRNKLLQSSERAFIMNWVEIKGLSVITKDL